MVKTFMIIMHMPRRGRVLKRFVKRLAFRSDMLQAWGVSERQDLPGSYLEGRTSGFRCGASPSTEGGPVTLLGRWQGCNLTAVRQSRWLRRPLRREAAQYTPGVLAT